MSLESDHKETPTNSEKEPESKSKPELADACQSKPRDKRHTSAIRTIKKDLGQFKDGVLKIFKDKEAKISEVKEKTALNILKDDLDLFRNELTTFTDDISGILRKGLRREDNSRIEAQENETEEKNSRKFNKDEEQKREKGKEGIEDEQSEDIEKDESFITKVQGPNEFSESADQSCKIKYPEIEKKSADVENSIEVKAQSGTKAPEEEQNSDGFWVEGWEMVEFEQSERTLNRKGNEEMKTESAVTLAEDELLPRTEHLISLSSGVSLLCLRRIIKNQQQGEMKDDIWSIKNFAQYLTLDPNTANPELVLSNGNRTAWREWGGGHGTRRPSDRLTEHPERFEHCPQVLCREGLLDVVYWEVQWTGGADVGVAYNSLSRRGPVSEGLLGQSEASWSLECSQGIYTPCHRRRRYRSVCPEPFSQTVGVFLDFVAGSLSFFCVSPGSMQHLHTFTATFKEPLYPGFWLWSWGGSVSLSQVELGWERLLH